MYFTNRQKNIILYIDQKSIASSEAVSGRTIAGHLNISLRTLQNEIRQINQACETKIIKSSQAGYYLNDQAIHELHLTPGRPEDDYEQILKLLIMENHSFDIDELADSFYISTSSMQQNLKKISDILVKYQIELLKYRNRVEVHGNEYDKRRLIHDMIMREIRLTYDMLKVTSDYLTNINIIEIQSVIMTAIQLYDYDVEPCYTTNLMVNIMTALSRIQSHHNVEMVVLQDCHELTEYKIASNICTEMEQRYHISIQDNDKYYITMLMMGQIKPTQDQQLIGSEHEEAILHIIQNTFEYYLLTVDYNTFMPNFIRHIQALLVRARNQQFVINLVFENVKETSPFVYDVAVYLAKSLEDYFQLGIVDEEIALLSIYIGFIIEQSTENHDKIRVLLLCNNYQNIAIHIMKRLKERHSGKLEIVGVITTPMEASSYKALDLIIHTVPFHYLGKRQILISPFYNEEDAKQVEDAIQAILASNRHKKNQNLLMTYFSQHLYFKNLGISGRNEAICFLGKQAEDCGLCEPGFTDSVLKRESMSSTCFVEQFAIPHAIDLNAKRTQFCVLIEESGIKWDKTNINCIFMIAVCQEDRKEFMKIYSGIIQVLLQKEMLKQIIEATDFSAFINCFSQDT